VDDEHDRRVEQSCEARERAWSAWGAVEPEVLTHLLNPALAGGPMWPNMRQAYRVARKGGLVLLASDGLADPFDASLFEGEEPPATDGLELEVFAIGAVAGDVGGSWLWSAVWQMAQNAAANGQLAALFDELDLLSIELEGIQVPGPAAARFVTEQGRVGALLGLAEPPIPKEVQGALSRIRLVNVKLLTVSELEGVRRRGTEGRTELAQRLAAQGDILVSSLDRPSVF
jgi:hypothetical protein